jgi:hypothetical protein
MYANPEDNLNAIRERLTWALLVTMMAPKKMIAITLQTKFNKPEKCVSVYFLDANVYSMLQRNIQHKVEITQ